MKCIAATLLAALCISVITGCEKDHADQKPANIEDAYYTGDGDNGPNSRKDVIVNGSFFKTTGNPDMSDCQTRLPNHPEPSKTNWVDCLEIKKRTGLQYVVVVDHSAAYDNVVIRVRGNDGKFSNAAQIRK